MALFHLHVTQVKRSAGQSVVTSAAYRAGEKLYSEYYGEVKLKDYDAEVRSDRVFSAGKASYIERNQEMIDDSDFCVFYYNETYVS